MKDMSRSISMLCPVCGNDQFESLDAEYQELNETPDETLLRCADCGSTFTKEELIKENSEKINIAVEEMKKDVAKEIEKELKKALKKWKL